MSIPAVVSDDWYAVAQSDDLDTGKTISIKLFDDYLVIWRSIDSIHGWRDACPHRGTRLSLGEVREGNMLVCPYHGWHFNTTGQCVKMPAHPEQNISARAKTTTYQVKEKHGLIWASTGNPIHDISPFYGVDEDYRTVIAGPYDVQTSAPRVIENFLDLAHFPFVHTGLFGAEPHTEIKDYEIEKSDDGIIARKCFVYQPQTNVSSGEGADVEYSYRIIRPLTVMLTKEPGAAGGKPQDIIMLSVQPKAEEQSRAWIVLAMNYEFEQPDSYFREFQNMIFDQDIAVLESQRPKRLPLDSGMEMHQPADKTSNAYRHWLKEINFSFGTILPGT
jgi:phenylpropionate dioxygenase-like ring-hydroxylating dioxygenase large terminal subunit